MSQFDALVQELDAMQKALPAESDDKKIVAAADGDEDEDGVKDGVDDAPGGDADASIPEETKKKDVEKDEEMMGKSFPVTLENGEKADAVDGTALVKSLIAKIDVSNADVTAALSSAVALIKSLHGTVTSLSKETEMLKGSLDGMRNEGRGRKATLSVLDKPAPVGSEKPVGLTRGEFFAKAHEARAAGRLQANDISHAESCFNRGEAVPDELLRRVLAG